MTSQEQSGLNVVKASVFRRWLVTAPYRGEQTTRLTGGHDYEEFEEKGETQRRECEIKRLPREKKLALAARLPQASE